LSYSLADFSRVANTLVNYFSRKKI